MWIKLTGPAAESLAKAFFEPAVVVLQENKGARRDAEVVTAEEDTAIMPISPGREAEGGGVEVTGSGGTIVTVETMSGKKLSLLSAKNNTGSIFVPFCPQVKVILKNKKERYYNLLHFHFTNAEYQTSQP